MVIFKRIEIDLDKERERIAKCDFTKRQREALLKLVELFEAGKWQECLDHVNDKKAFGYDKENECHEMEYISMAISDVLSDLGYTNFYTQADLLQQAREKIAKERS